MSDAYDDVYDTLSDIEGNVSGIVDDIASFDYGGVVDGDELEDIKQKLEYIVSELEDAIDMANDIIDSI